MFKAKQSGRKPGSLVRFTCCLCGECELVRGGDNKFVCSSCLASGGERPGELFGNGGPFAMGLVHRAIVNGELAAVHTCLCADCGKVAQHYDHRDYNRPLDVEPVCHSCNLKRGPAIPRKGYFAGLFSGKLRWHYRRKADAQRMFVAMGVQIDLSNHPRTLSFEHWLSFKDLLLEWDSKEFSA